MQCLACNVVINYPDSESLKCVSCRDSYHYRCMNMTTEYYTQNRFGLREKWRCMSCCNVSQRRKDNNDRPITPITKRMFQDGIQDMSFEDQAHSLSISEKMGEETTSILDQKSTAGATTTSPLDPTINMSTGNAGMLDILSHFDIRFEKMNAKLDSVRASISMDINKTIEDLKKDFTRTTDFLSSQISDVVTGYKSLANRIQVLESENYHLKDEISILKKDTISPVEGQSLKETISKLQIELNDREQESLANDVEIGGIPEFQSESAVHLVTTVATKFGVTLEMRDVVSANRVGVPGASPRGPRRIVVRLARRVVRDDLLRAARARRNTTSGGLGLPEHEPKQLYVVERLTKANRILFAKAREARAEAGWRFVWTKDGRILARKSESPGSPVHRLRSEKDIERVFDVKCKNTNP